MKKTVNNTTAEKTAISNIAETVKNEKLTDREIQFNRLLEASNQAREIRDAIVEYETKEEIGRYLYPRNLNYYILNHVYKQYEGEEFKTFDEWKKEGETIKRGAKAYPIWGKPQRVINEETGEEKVYYPMNYVFSSMQIEEREEVC